MKLWMSWFLTLSALLGGFLLGFHAGYQRALGDVALAFSGLWS